ncbi:MAG: SusF/SusE family outer membrane protein [Bacteroidales bacterium]|nr:SusF/SusE family outer membrane protein [Bacteroidales bacterium]
MKNTFIYKTVVALALMLAVMGACTEKTADIRLDAKMSTSEVVNIKSDQATVIGFVVAEGAGFIQKGICYDTEAEPSIGDTKIEFEGEDEGATFSVTLTGLDYATTYYARAYAINYNTTLYGDELTFTTLPVVPALTTADITEISYTSATGGGTVTSNGGAEITARGICYSTSSGPTVADAKTTDGDGMGSFTSYLSGLDDGTMYYVRAYATNRAGTAYGPEVSFTTLVPLDRTWYVPGSYVEASYPGSGLANWSPDKSPQVKSGLSAPDKLEGYVYMANTSNEWKFATKPSWDGPNYGDGGGGTLSEAGGNMVSPAGYYFIQADAGAMTFSAVATVWGVIGEASPLGWGDETPLTYQPELQQWIGGMHLTAAEMKFRANHDWDYNYGSSAGDNTLNAGGANIAIASEGDYAITLDLSTPLAYTYRADRWGIIGSATPNEWNDPDTDMTWDPVGEVFTITVDLTQGEMKFRANDGWDYNLGGDLAALEAGGSNIPVTTDGNYTITLDPWNLVATITMN